MAARLNFLFGFLGSGKTTLLQRILDQRVEKEKLAVIVNEFGKVGIDGSIIAGRNIDMIELTSGCLCCTLKGDLLNAIDEILAGGNIRRIIIEATGVAQPHDLIKTFTYASVRDRYDIGPVVTVVDSSKYFKLKDGLGKFYQSQIELADVIILNKSDITPAEPLRIIHADVHNIAPQADIYISEHCDVDIGRLLDGQSRMAAQLDGQGHGITAHHDHLPVESLVLESAGDFPRARVDEFFGDLPENIWRAKGYMNIEGQSCLVQFAAGTLDIRKVDSLPLQSLVFIGQLLSGVKLAERLAKLRDA